MNPKTENWVSTKTMAQSLGCCNDHLYRQVRNGNLSKGEHYFILNPSAFRPTYRWNLQAVKRSLISHER